MPRSLRGAVAGLRQDWQVGARAGWQYPADGGLQPGDRIAGYRLERVIGRGGFGAVYLAEDTRLGRRVALKVIATELAGDPDVRRRFVAESRSAASLDHPHIIPIFEADEADGHLFLAMRYVPPPDLEGRLRERGRLTLDATVSLIGQVASALDAAHAVGLVHRDVKPGNILLAAGSKPGLDHAYLADFGLTKQARGQRSATKSGQLIGSVGYVAPEQIQGRAVDARADIYSLGCVAFECLGGRPPFARDTEVAQVLAHLDDPPPSLADLRPEVPAEVDAVIARALSKDVDARYPTAGDFAAALAGAAERDPARDPLTRGFLFSDLRGYTAFVESHGDRAAVDLLDSYRKLVREVVARRGGAEIKTEGDSFYVVFPSASGAVQAGLDIVERTAAASRDRPERPINVGVGIHAGESAATAEGYVGSAVNIAARVCAQAAAGEVLVTETVRSLVRTSLPVALASRGRRQLKGVDEPVACYAVTRTDGPARSITTTVPTPRSRNPRVVGAAAAVVAAVALAVIGGSVLLGRPASLTPTPAGNGAVAPAGSTSGGESGSTTPVVQAGGDWVAYTAMDLPGARYDAQANGEAIACSAYNAKIHLAHADGTGDIKLTTGSDLYEAGPQWAPDGSRILFRGFAQNAGVDVYTVAPDGTGLTQVTDEHSRQGVDHARWSPDGARIVYGLEDGIYVIRPDGTGRQTVHKPMEYDTPPPSPDPSDFAASAPTWATDGRIGAIRDGRLITMRDDGSDVQPVAPGLDIVIDEAAWSPDGKRIILEAHASGDPPWPTGADLYIMAADGSDLRQLTSAKGDELRPSWSPDGTQIVFDTLVDGVPGVMAMPATGGDAHPITTPTAALAGCDGTLGRPSAAFAAVIANPSPQPSGAKLTFDRGPLAAGTYRVDRFDPPFEFTVGNGWYGFRDYVDGWAIQPFGALIAQPAELDAIKPQVIHTSGCFESPTKLIGPRPLDFYEALKARKDLVLTDPVPINVGSSSGLQFELSRAPGKVPACDTSESTALFESGQDSYWFFDKDTMLVTALDVRGGTVAFLFETATDRMEDAKAIVQPIMNSLRFDR